MHCGCGRVWAVQLNVAVFTLQGETTWRERLDLRSLNIPLLLAHSRSKYRTLLRELSVSEEFELGHPNGAQAPQTLRQAITMYIDFLLTQNERKVHVARFNRNPPMAADFETENYYHEVRNGVKTLILRKVHHRFHIQIEIQRLSWIQILVARNCFNVSLFCRRLQRTYIFPAICSSSGSAASG